MEILAGVVKVMEVENNDYGVLTQRLDKWRWYE